MNVTASSVLASLRSPHLGSPEWLRPDLEIVGNERVPVASLTSVFDELALGDAARVFLKMDTQGWDLEVMKGATGCLDRIPAIQTELSVIPLYEGMPTWLQSLSYLHDLGYEPTWVAPVTNDGPIRVLEFDCVMLRA